MRYTKETFDRQFPDEQACLDAIFQKRYGDIDTCPHCGVIGTKFYKVRGRKCYACMHCSYQLHPLAETIFHKSSTPLRSWFYAMYLFSVSRNGVAAKELERHLGVTYKTAHRMARQIRSLMGESGGIGGPGSVLEIDETYYGKYQKGKVGGHGKSTVMGVVERGGSVRASVTLTPNIHVANKFIAENVKLGSELHTDESLIYKHAQKTHVHRTINHRLEQYSLNGVTTNTIEGFWGQLKRSISGTYHFVSPKYLQLYVDEFSFRYSYRGVAVYPVLLERAATRV